MNKNNFLHPLAVCESATVGQGTRIWAFAHILPGARIGSDCNICDHVFIENDVVVGNRVTIKSGVQLWDGLRVGNDVFIGPNATLTNDPFPRSKVYPDRYAETFIQDGASIGGNATILPGLKIGQKAMVGAGSVVTKNVPPYAVVAGNPARIVGYADTEGAIKVQEGESVASCSSSLPVKGAKSFVLKRVADIRGSLSVGSFGQDLPFIPRRYFVVFDVPGPEVRGQHAHRNCEQFLICVHGSVRLMLDDGKRRCQLTLDKPEFGIYIPPMVWAVQYKHSLDAVLLVFASHEYDPDDYIRDYSQFLELVSSNDGCKQDR